MNKIDNTTKAKLLFILLMSNISIYMLCSTPEEIVTPEETTSLFRKDYTELKIHANLLTSFEENKPISILDKNKTVVVKYALMLRQVSQSQNDFNLDTQGTEYIIYLPDSEITKLLNQKNLFILPFGKNYGVAKRVRKSYEINI